MSANPDTAAPTGRIKPAQGKERSDAAMSHASQNTSSPEGATEGGELRDGWRTAPFGEVVDILDSRRIPVNSDERVKRVGDVPYYGATGQVGVIDKHIFDEEFVLRGEDGAPFLDSAKPKAYLIRGKEWVNNHAHVLHGNPGLMNGFSLYQLNNLDYRPYDSGTTRLKLPQGPMEQIPLLVPPLAKQTRIVAEVEQRLVVIDHNLAFDPSLMADFWAAHAFRDARQVWSAAFREGMSAEFRAALGHLPAIWREMPEEWTEVDSGISLAAIESLLWQFDREADRFWRLL